MTKDLALVEIGAPLAASGLPPSRAYLKKQIEIGCFGRLNFVAVFMVLLPSQVTVKKCQISSTAGMCLATDRLQVTVRPR